MKVTGAITHEKRLADTSPELEQFLEMMNSLKDKLLALLIQLPLSLTAKEGLGKLERMIPFLDKNFRYAIEVRHNHGLRLMSTNSYLDIEYASHGVSWTQYKRRRN